MTPVPSPRRRRPRVSVGVLMTLVLAVALPAAWMANTIRTQRAALAAVRAANGVIRFDYQEEVVPTGQGPPAWSRTEPTAPAWLRRWLGDELFQQPRTVYFNDPTSPTILAQVGHFEQLRLFALNSPVGAGDGSLHLERVRSLDNLGLSGPWVDDAILAEIARLPGLLSLRLHDSSATDAGFALLAAHPRLRNLTLMGCGNLTDAGLARLLVGLPSLRYLSLSGGPPGKRLARTVAALARHHPDLQSLSISHLDFTDANLAAIGRMDGLEYLHIDSRTVTDAGLAHLRSLVQLKNLYLSIPKMTDAGLAHLAVLDKLKQLNLPFGGFTDAGMVTIAGLDRLEVLKVPFNLGLTDAGLVPLRRLANFHDFDARKTGITPAGVAALQQDLPKLRSVRTGP